MTRVCHFAQSDADSTAVLLYSGTQGFVVLWYQRAMECMEGFLVYFLG